MRIGWEVRAGGDEEVGERFECGGVGEDDGKGGVALCYDCVGDVCEGRICCVGEGFLEVDEADAGGCYETVIV